MILQLDSKLVATYVSSTVETDEGKDISSPSTAYNGSRSSLMNLAEGADENEPFTEEQPMMKAVNITGLDSGRFMNYEFLCWFLLSNSIKIHVISE